MVHLNTIKEYNERHQRVRRLTVLMEDEEDERLAVESEKKVVEQGTCEGFSQKDVDKILQEFGDILDPEPRFRIDTGDSKPIHQHPYRPPDSLLASMKEELDTLLDKNIITKSTSPWSSPIIPVKKTNGKIRICVDYRKVNALTRPIKFYMPYLRKFCRNWDNQK